MIKRHVKIYVMQPKKAHRGKVMTLYTFSYVLYYISCLYFKIIKIRANYS